MRIKINRSNDGVENLIGGIVLLISLIFTLLGFIGWVKNVYSFVNLDFREPYKAEAVRFIGIPIGFIGAIEGYMTIEDK